jgi:putative MFS transporter
MVVGCVVLITINALIFGFVNWIPTFFIKQGLGVNKSLGYTLVINLGSLVGCTIGAFSADRLGRRRTILGATVLTIAAGALYPYVAELWQVLTVGFILMVGIYILTALLYGVYTSELFPTEVRLRANGICNMFGRGTTVITSSFLIVALFTAYGVGGVLSMMIGLLVIQFIVVAIWGIEPARKGLEQLDPGKAA